MEEKITGIAEAEHILNIAINTPNAGERDQLWQELSPKEAEGLRVAYGIFRMSNDIAERVETLFLLAEENLVSETVKTALLLVLFSEAQQKKEKSAETEPPVEIQVEETKEEPIPLRVTIAEKTVIDRMESFHPELQPIAVHAIRARQLKGAEKDQAEEDVGREYKNFSAKQANILVAEATETNMPVRAWGSLELVVSFTTKDYAEISRAIHNALRMHIGTEALKIAEGATDDSDIDIWADIMSMFYNKRDGTVLKSVATLYRALNSIGYILGKKAWHEPRYTNANITKILTEFLEKRENLRDVLGKKKFNRAEKASVTVGRSVVARNLGNLEKAESVSYDRHERAMTGIIAANTKTVRELHAELAEHLLGKSKEQVLRGLGEKIEDLNLRAEKLLTQAFEHESPFDINVVRVLENAYHVILMRRACAERKCLIETHGVECVVDQDHQFFDTMALNQELLEVSLRQDEAREEARRIVQKNGRPTAESRQLEQQALALEQTAQEIAFALNRNANTVEVEVTV